MPEEFFQNFPEEFFHTLEGLLVLVEKASFSKEFRSEFHGGGGHKIPHWSAKNKKTLRISMHFRTNRFTFEKFHLCLYYYTKLFIPNFFWYPFLKLIFHLRSGGVSYFTTQAMSWRDSFRTFIKHGPWTGSKSVRIWLKIA